MIAWATLNNSNPSSLDEIVNQIIWNNTHIFVDGKSAFNQRSFSKGLCKVGDLFELVCIKLHITELQLNVLDLLYLMGLYHSLPLEWKKLMARNKREMPLKTILYNGAEHSEVESLPSKKIYHLYISKISKPPTAKKKFEEQCASN